MECRNHPAEAFVSNIRGKDARLARSLPRSFHKIEFYFSHLHTRVIPIMLSMTFAFYGDLLTECFVVILSAHVKREF